MAKAASQPLSRFSVLRSADFDEIRQVVSRTFCPHQIELLGRRRRMDATENLAPLVASSLVFLGYGAPVRVSPELGEDFYLVLLPTDGRVLLATEDHRLVLERGASGAVLSPCRAFELTGEVDSTVLIWKVARTAIDRFLGSYLGREIRRPVLFHPAFDLRRGGMALWSRMFRTAAEEIDQVGSTFPSGGALSTLEEMLIAGLLRGQPNSYEEALAPPISAIAPRAVRRVEEFISAHAEEDLTLQALAAVARVSGRTLDKSFRQFRDTTPMTHLRKVRMERVRADLLAAPPGTTVTEVLTRWGVTQFGRFAGAYGRCYGETPRSTLWRNR